MDVSSAFQVALAVLASLGGGGLLVFVLSSWLGKVWANRILESDRRRYSEELERVHGELEKAVHVHRVQFETEFGALSEIWAKLSAVRATMGEVRPMTDIRDPDEDPDARFQRRFRRFQEAFNDFVRAVDDRSPFYPEDIYQELSAAIQVARREAIGAHIDRRDEPNWYQAGRENFQELVQRSQRISELIRVRLASLRVS